MTPHRGNRWTSSEDNQLRQLIAENTSSTLISAKLMRSSEAIRMCMFKLRIQENKKSSRGEAGNTKVFENDVAGMTKPDIWYVAYEPNRAIQSEGKRHYARTTKTFSTEIEAKNFAAEILSKGWTASAGTLNPHEPKKVVTPSKIRDWAFSATPKASSPYDDE